MNALLLRKSIRDYAVLEFSRSGGPGGQNVNKVNTKVTLRIKLICLAGLSEAELTRVLSVLSNRITTEGEIVISSNEERSQHINRERAYARIETLVSSAARLPRVRHPTKPSRAAREERLQSKRRRGFKKAERRIILDES